MKYQDKWGDVQNNDVFVKGDNLKVRSYRTKNEKLAIKKNTINVICFILITLAAIFSAKSGELLAFVKFAVIIFISYCVLAHLLAFSSRDEQRKRITLKSKSLEKKREYRKIQSARAEEQRKIDEKAKIAREEEMLDKRLEEAMKPVDWESYKPKKPKKTIKTPDVKNATKGRVKPFRHKRQKTFKAVDIGDI